MNLRKFCTFAEDKAKIKLKIEDSSYAVSDKTFFEHKDTKTQSRYLRRQNIVYPRLTLMAIKH
jgi:hypothetical protein